MYKLADLYTYVPKENTVATDGLLSTALSRDGWEKYAERSGESTKEGVLRWLDLLDPTFKRSDAVTVLSEPIPEDAHPDFRTFAARKQLVRVADLKDLIKNNIVKQVRSINVGGKGTHTVTRTPKRPIAWKNKKPGRFLFSNVPHYLLETTTGKIPKEYLQAG